MRGEAMSKKPIFISHSSADHSTVRRIAVMLAATGLGVWLDDWDIAPGDSIPKLINEGLSMSDTAILIWSKSAAASPWVGAEVDAITHQYFGVEGKKLIIIKLDDTSLPLLLSSIKYLSLTGESEEDYQKIIFAVTGETPKEEYAQALLEVYGEEFYNFATGKPFPYVRCPICGSKELEEDTDYEVGDIDSGDYASYKIIRCKVCEWKKPEWEGI